MIKKHFPVILEQDKDGVFIASCPIFKGCHTYGYTIDEAVTNITEAIEVCLEDSAEDMKIQLYAMILKWRLKIFGNSSSNIQTKPPPAACHAVCNFGHSDWCLFVICNLRFGA